MVLERRHQALLQNAILMQQVISSAIGGQKGHNAFKQGVARHNIETVPYHPREEGEDEGQ